MEEYEPKTEHVEEVEEEITFESEEISKEDLDELMRETNWLLTKNMIETTVIENFLDKHEVLPIEDLVIQATSSQWTDAVNALTAISALVGNKRVTIEKAKHHNNLTVYERSWEWMNDEDRANIVRKREHRRETRNKL